MFELHASLLLIACRDLAMATAIVVNGIQAGNGENSITKFDTVHSDLARVLKALREETGALPLTPAVRYAMDFLSQRIDAKEEMTYRTVEALLKQLNNEIIVDLQANVFLVIPWADAALYRQATPPFGEAVLDRFPGARRGIEAAARCRAFGEWDAAVYHLMMVAGEGLRALAIDLEVEKGATFEYEEWGNVIDQIESAVKQIRDRRRSPEKVAALEYYSKVTTQSARFKDAWRLSVAHGRLQADERETRIVFDSVHEFMNLLATGLGPERP